MAQKIVYWLLIALVLSLGFGQLLRFEYLGVPIYLNDLLVIAILFLQGQALQVKKIDLRGLALLGAGLTLGWVFALLHYPITQLLIPSLYTLRLLAYLALYFVLKRSKLAIPHSIFLFSGLVTLVIGLSQYVLLPDMRLFQYLGWDDHLNRLTLPHFDPTFTAIMLTLALLSVMPTRFYILYPVFTLAILLTYSRSVWLSLAVTFSYFMLKNKKSSYLIIGICLLIIPILFLPKKFGEGTNLLRTYSITSRFASDLTYIQKYKWDLLIGRGMNTLILDSPAVDTTNHATGPNNSYLYLLTTTGLLGLTGWGIFMYSLFTKSAHKPMLIFFFIASLFNNVMFYPFSLLWVLLISSQYKNSLELGA